MKYAILAFLLTLEIYTVNSQPLALSIDRMGARGIKSQDVTSIIQKAIDSCYVSGGGTVIIPPGSYTSSTIRLKDHVKLDLRQGASLYASTSPGKYARERNQYTGPDHTPVLIYARDARDIAVTGRGKIIGQPRYSIEPLDPSSFIEREYQIAEEAGLSPMAPVREEPSVSLIYFSECSNVNISDISLIDSPFWGLHIHWSERVSVSHVFVHSNLKMGVNSDGIDIDGSRDVTITDCVISTGDDAVVLKTTRKDGKHRSCENVLVTNCILTSASCALKLGTESYDDFRHIIFNNNIIRNTNRAFGIFIRDGGTASDVIFSNITAETNRKEVHWWGNGELLTFAILKRNFFSKVGRIHDVTVRNIMADVQGTSLVAGYGDHPIRNLSLENIDMHIDPESRSDKRTTDGFQFQKAASLNLDDVTVYWNLENPQQTWESSFSFQNIEGLFAEGLVAGSPFEQTPNAAIELDKVDNASFNNTYALPGTGTFFSIGRDVDNLYFINNRLYNAETKYRVDPDGQSAVHINSPEAFKPDD